MTIHYHRIEDTIPGGEVMRAVGALYAHARQLTDVGTIVAGFELTIDDGSVKPQQGSVPTPYKPPCSQNYSRN